MKTYSIAILSGKNNVGVTNFGKYFKLDDIDWVILEKFCIEKHNVAYGCYYGTNSNKLTSRRCRTIVKILDEIRYDELKLKDKSL